MSVKADRCHACGQTTTPFVCGRCGWSAPNLRIRRCRPCHAEATRRRNKGIFLPRPSADERFARQYYIDGDHWMWRNPSSGGYGTFSDGRPQQAHRWSYRRFVGPIPPGLVIDHLCRRPGCVNPKHLEAVTSAENTRRGQGPSMIVSRSGMCARGHPRTAENAYRREDGTIAYCRPCRRDWWRAKYAQDPAFREAHRRKFSKWWRETAKQDSELLERRRAAARDARKKSA